MSASLKKKEKKTFIFNYNLERRRWGGAGEAEEFRNRKTTVRDPGPPYSTLLGEWDASRKCSAAASPARSDTCLAAAIEFKCQQVWKGSERGGDWVEYPSALAIPAEC